MKSDEAANAVVALTPASGTFLSRSFLWTTHVCTRSSPTPARVHEVGDLHPLCRCIVYMRPLCVAAFMFRLACRGVRSQWRHTLFGGVAFEASKKQPKASLTVVHGDTMWRPVRSKRRRPVARLPVSTPLQSRSVAAARVRHRMRHRRHASPPLARPTTMGNPSPAGHLSHRTSRTDWCAFNGRVLGGSEGSRTLGFTIFSRALFPLSYWSHHGDIVSMLHPERVRQIP